MLPGQLRQEIRAKRRKPYNATYQAIADDYGISKGAAWKIAHGYPIGPKIAALLHLDPEPKLRYTRTRRERLDAIAREWGFASWVAYETHVLHHE